MVCPQTVFASRIQKEIIRIMVFQHVIIILAHNARPAAAGRVLLDFIFAIRSHVQRPGITLPPNSSRNCG